MPSIVISTLYNILFNPNNKPHEYHLRKLVLERLNHKITQITVPVEGNRIRISAR